MVTFVRVAAVGRAAAHILVIAMSTKLVTRSTDIRTRADCERLVWAFYGRAMRDPVIGYLFTDVAKLDLEAHVPRMTSYWETLLLGAHSYSGSAFRVHLELHAKVPLRHGHFERWLYLWRATVDEFFGGPVAELAKVHAERVAGAFCVRLDAIEGGSAGPLAAGPRSGRLAAGPRSGALLHVIPPSAPGP